MGIPYINIVKDRVARLAGNPALSEVGITAVTAEHVAPAVAQSTLALACAKGDVLITLDDLDPRGADTVPAVVMGVPQDAPNPARKDQSAFIMWLATHPQLVDPPLDPAKMARSAWLEKYGQVPQCYLCGHPMRWVALKDGGGFWGCAQFRGTECKGSLNVDEDNLIQPRCPDCGKPMRELEGAKGRFWGCVGYRDGCRRTMDGPVGDGLRTEIDDWLPSAGGGMPATARQPRRTGAGGAPPNPPLDNPFVAVPVSSATRAQPPGPLPVSTPFDEEGGSGGGERATSLAALRRRFKNR